MKYIVIEYKNDTGLNKITLAYSCTVWYPGHLVILASSKRQERSFLSYLIFIIQWEIKKDPFRTNGFNLHRQNYSHINILWLQSCIRRKQWLLSLHDKSSLAKLNAFLSRYNELLLLPCSRYLTSF